MSQAGYIRTYAVVIAGVTVLVALVVSFLFASQIARPVIELRSLMKEAQEGNLSVRFEGREILPLKESEFRPLRRRMQMVFQDPYAALNPRLASVARQRGMFSQIQIAPEAVARLKDEHGIYMVGSGRINVAGFRDDGEIERFAKAVASVQGDA